MLCPLCQYDNPPGTPLCAQCGRAQTRICANCGTELPAAAKFCLECGARQEGAEIQRPASPRAVAPRDRRSADPRAYTPNHLVERILTTRSAIEGERKQVTVLFVDVRGSLSMAEEVDPERWHEIMEGFFAILAEGVHRFDGTINQYTGDGIMALFGAPLALEAHAEGACSAALHLAEGMRRYSDELRRSEGINLSLRMGLNSGEVVVGKIGDDLRMDYTAQGHTVGLAARMEQLAAPDQIYLTEHTAELVEGFFSLRDLGPFRVKGVREPVRVYALDSVGPLRTRLDAARARGFSRFVGRDVEMALLEGALQRALQGEGGVITVCAPPGVGKSRLCHEFGQTCRDRSIRVVQAHCVPHGRTIPFLQVLDLLRQIFAIAERDSAAAARSKVAGAMLLLDPRLTDRLPLLLDFLGIADLEHPAPAMDPEIRLGRLLDLMRRLMLARSHREPGVMVLEDLHWIDPGSERFLEVLVDTALATRTLLLVNFRPTYQESWLARPEIQRLDLVPLGREASDALLSELLGPGDEILVLADRIRDRTAGNPFFIEEVVRSLFEHGVLGRDRRGVRVREPLAEVQIPPSVQAVLEARIDRLTETEKAVLQTAAVIGPEFAERVLLRVAAQESELASRPQEIAAALRLLEVGDFVVEKSRHPEVLFGFRHPLTQEAAYRSQLSARRSRVHAAVARAVEELYADNLDERAALLAQHWEGAGEVLQAARWSRRAAEWLRHSNLAEAMRYRRNILELLRSQEETDETAQMALESHLQILELGWRLGLSAEEALETFAAGEELATRHGNTRALAMLVNSYAALRSHFGSAEDFLQGCERATQLADQTSDVGLQLATRARLVIALASCGELRTALSLSEQAVAVPPIDLRLGAEVLGYSPYIRMIKEKARFLIDAGRLDEGEAELEHAAALADAHEDVEVLGHVHAEYATLARVRGDAEAALVHAREAMLIADRLGSPFFRAASFMAFGHAHILAAKWSEAIDALGEVLRIATAGRAGVEAEPLARAWLAAAHIGSGDLDLARHGMEEALEVARRRATRLAECVAYIGHARVLLRGDIQREREAIELDLSRALSLAERIGAHSNAPFVHLERGRLAAALGDAETRRNEFVTAHRLFSAMGAGARAERVARELAL